MGTLVVGTRTLHGTKRVPQWSHIGSTVLFQVLGSRCLTGSALLDCHVLKGFGIYMIGILGRPYCPEWKTEALLLDVNYSV